MLSLNPASSSTTSSFTFFKIKYNSSICRKSVEDKLFPGFLHIFYRNYFLLAFMKRLVVCLLLLLNINTIKGQNLDLRILESVNGPAASADQTWRHVSASVYIVSATAPVSMLITGIASHNSQLTVKAAETGASVLIAEGITFGLKNVVKRQRPYLAYPDLITGKSSSTDYSFPSGHSSVAFATATSLSLAFPKWYVIVPSFAYAASVGYSRMYLGVHYPSDVFGGAIIGAGTAYLTWKLQKVLTGKGQNKFHRPH